MNKLEVKNISHYYQDGMKKKKVLNNISVTFESGKFYTILGESGSGKTTFLSLLSGLLKIEEGDLLYNEESIKKIGYNNYRLKMVNIIFQNYNLIPYMTARENVETLMDIRKVKSKNKKEDAYKLLEEVGINRETADRNVNLLSGGESQRVAIARSLASDIPILVADEPTGNLDSDNEQKIIKLFKKLAKDGKIVIVVTHSEKVAKNADFILKIKEGGIVK